ncbi:MAG TPA: terminase small subunit [Pseudorhizobium sp.]|jgi:phage terminase Nu1 subunit (DNA packaging protein)|nr:terminase small subunit [Pseudorhizobium sp.]
MTTGTEVSQTDLADIFGVTDTTIRAWERDGMPVIAKGSRGLPDAYDTAACIEWRLAQVLARVPAEQPGDVVSEDEARRRKIYAEAQLAELKLDVERGELVEISAVGEEVDAVFSQVRARLLAIPGALALALTNEPDPTVIRDRVFGEVAAALTELSSHTGEAA